MKICLVHLFIRLLLEWNGMGDLTRKPLKDGAGKIYCINWQRPLYLQVPRLIDNDIETKKAGPDPAFAIAVGV